MPLKNISIIQALKDAANRFKKAKIDSAWLDAEILLAFVLKRNRSYILSHDDTLTKSQYQKYQLLTKKRLNFLPIAYILGYKEFYGLSFKVNKDTLVPRPESELIVEMALSLINKNTTLIDLGTGSGCLIISILKNLKIKPKKSIAVDISTKALKIAKYNSQKNKIKNIEFKKSNLLKNIKLPNGEIIILANLPYLKTKQMKEPSIKHEPKQALVAGNDGLKYYKELSKQLKNAKQKITLLCEINPEQKLGFKKIFPKAEFKKDLSKKTRLAIIKPEPLKNTELKEGSLKATL